MAATARTVNSSLADVKTSVNALSAKVPSTLGQKTMANSLSVVLASDSPAAAAGGAADPLTDPNNIVRNIFLKLGSGYYESIVNPETVGCAQAQMPNPADGGAGPAKIMTSEISNIGSQFRIVYINAAGAEVTETLTLSDVGGVSTATTATNCISIQELKCLTSGASGTLTVQLYSGGYETIYTTPIWGTGGDEGAFVQPAFQMIPVGYRGFVRINSIVPWGLTGWTWTGLIEYPNWISGSTKYKPHWGIYMSPSNPGDFVPAKVPETLLGPFEAGSALSVKWQRNSICYAGFSLTIVLVPL